jgi:hypothetical protein
MAAVCHGATAQAASAGYLPSNREILQRAATQWRKMAEQAAVGEAPTQAASTRVPTSVDPGNNGKG